MATSIQFVPLPLSDKENVCVLTVKTQFSPVSQEGDSLHCKSGTMNSVQHQEHGSNRQVTFDENTRVIPASSPLDLLSIEEVPNIWYQVEDLAAFRQETRELCRSMRLEPKAAQNMEQKACCLALNSETRGLESRCCLERQRRKYLAGRCVVRLQSKMCADQLAVLAIKCNRWAVDLAQEEGARDHVRAYLDKPQSQQHDLIHLYEEVTTLAGRKRDELSDREDVMFSDRRVRAKVSA